MPDMQKPLSDAQLRELLKLAASAYVQRQNELNRRELQARKCLEMMLEVAQPVSECLNSLNVPAKLRREKTGIVFEVGEAPNTAGQISVTQTPDFMLIVAQRSTSGSGDVVTQDQSPRDPSDFGVPHWRSELAEALQWILGSELDDGDHDFADDRDDDE
jgi:hypothetical protein